MSELILSEFNMKTDLGAIEYPSWISSKLWNKQDWNDFLLNAQYYNWTLSVSNGSSPVESYYEVTRDQFLKNLRISTDSRRIQAFQILYGSEFDNFENIYDEIKDQIGEEKKKFTESLEGKRSSEYGWRKEPNTYPNDLYELKIYDRQFITPEIQQLLDEMKRAYEFDQYIFSLNENHGITDEVIEANPILSKALNDIEGIPSVDESSPLPERIEAIREYLAEWKKHADIIKSYLKPQFI